MLQRHTIEGGAIVYRSPLLNEIGVPHAFTTRVGGFSNGPFASFNFGNPPNLQDSEDALEKNHRRLFGGLHCADRIRNWVHQVHGGEALLLQKEVSFENGSCADALVTDDASRMLCIRTADCVPTLLSTRDGAAVAAIHSGWRGIISDIIPHAVATLRKINDAPILAAVGPCIGFDAFEIGLEVAKEFSRHFGNDAPIASRADSTFRADLAAAAQLQLLRAGILRENIDTTDLCSHRDADEFFSHRRERGITGRMLAVIGCIA